MLYPSSNLTSQMVPKFFLPGMTEYENEIIYPFLRQKAQEIALQITERKIEGVLFRRFGKLYLMRVGLSDPFIYRETILCIFESSVCFLAFTPNRGVIQGSPYIMGRSEILCVSDFE